VDDDAASFGQAAERLISGGAAVYRGPFREMEQVRCMALSWQEAT
jgi:hypothetical protein